MEGAQDNDAQASRILDPDEGAQQHEGMKQAKYPEGSSTARSRSGSEGGFLVQHHPLEDHDAHSQHGDVRTADQDDGNKGNKRKNNREEKQKKEDGMKKRRTPNKGEGEVEEERTGNEDALPEEPTATETALVASIKFLGRDGKGEEAVEWMRRGEVDAQGELVSLRELGARAVARRIAHSVPCIPQRLPLVHHEIPENLEDVDLQDMQLEDEGCGHEKEEEQVRKGKWLEEVEADKLRGMADEVQQLVVDALVGIERCVDVQALALFPNATKIDVDHHYCVCLFEFLSCLNSRLVQIFLLDIGNFHRSAKFCFVLWDDLKLQAGGEWLFDVCSRLTQLQSLRMELATTIREPALVASLASEFLLCLDL